MRDEAASRFLFWVFRIVELNIVLPVSRLTIRYKGERGCDNRTWANILGTRNECSAYYMRLLLISVEANARMATFEVSRSNSSRCILVLELAKDLVICGPPKSQIMITDTTSVNENTCYKSFLLERIQTAALLRIPPTLARRHLLGSIFKPYLYSDGCRESFD